MDNRKVNMMFASVLYYSNCQAMLPATGAPVSRQRASKMREMFDEYVRIRTLENWKFWIVSFTSLQIRFGGKQYVRECVYLVGSSMSESVFISLSTLKALLQQIIFILSRTVLLL
jgi:hypothetical protein